MIGAVFITCAGLYLLYRGYNVGVKKELSTKDNPRLPDKIANPDGYCKFLSRIFNILGVLTLISGLLCFLDNTNFIDLGNYIWFVYGGLLTAVVVCSVILSKGLDKFY